MSQSVVFEERNTAFRRRLQTFALVNVGHIDINQFFSDALPHFVEKISALIEEHTLIKVNGVFKAVFEKVIVGEENDTIERQTVYVHTKNSVVDFETDISEFFNDFIVEFVLNKIDEIPMRGSGFSLSEIVELLVQANEFQPVTGSTYIDLPAFVKAKHAVINVRNNDNMCFKYAVLSAIHPVELNPQRTVKYMRFFDELRFDNITFPIQIKDIGKFEALNPNISINVYMFDEKREKILTLRMTKAVKQNHIHLLLLVQGDLGHYCWIKYMSRLLSSQLSKNCKKKLFCDRCLNYFYDQQKLESHTEKCPLQNECTIEMPTAENNIIRFKNIGNQLKAPFIIYADIETLLKEPTTQFCSTSENTRAYQQHEAFSIGYYFHCLFDNTKSYYSSFRGEDCIEWFVKQLYSIANDISTVLNEEVQPLDTTIMDEIFFSLTDECHICGERYTENDTPVRDHCHLTGKYRGSAHSSCNLNFQTSRNVPIVFHNLTHYDSHFLMRKLATVFDGNISIIPVNDQNYISFTKTVADNRYTQYQKFIKLRFIDSFRFMASSLDQLSSLIPSEKKTILHEECAKRNMSKEQAALLERKGVCCYDYLTSYEKLNETQLPAKSEFYSKLTETDISDESYNFAQDIWNKFHIKTLGDYCDLYLMTDVLLLADVFENFRANCHKTYRLDPAHYYTAPGLSFDAMLKYTKVEIELLTDIDMLMFVENGIRGGISQCSKRYVKANNKYMADHDSTKDSSYIIYLDANNLYGWSMMQSLPLDSFKWGNPYEFNCNNILSIADDDEIGYIFEVDLFYPQYLHDHHRDYPLCAENRTVPFTKNEKKLLLSLFHKKNYVIHYKMLKFVLRQGLILHKVHRVLQFRQSKWMKPYIELNTVLRTKASNDFEKNFYKLLINVIYGKTMEDVRGHSDIRIKTYWDGRYGAHKLMAQPNFKRATIFDENLIAVHMNKMTVCMNKPIIIGLAVLELSKVLMCDFHYNHMKEKYGNNIEVIYTGKTIV